MIRKEVSSFIYPENAILCTIDKTSENFVTIRIELSEKTAQTICKHYPRKLDVMGISTTYEYRLPSNKVFRSKEMKSTLAKSSKTNKWILDCRAKADVGNNFLHYLSSNKQNQIKITLFDNASIILSVVNQKKESENTFSSSKSVNPSSIPPLDLSWSHVTFPKKWLGGSENITKKINASSFDGKLKFEIEDSVMGFIRNHISSPGKSSFFIKINNSIVNASLSKRDAKQVMTCYASKENARSFLTALDKPDTQFRLSRVPNALDYFILTVEINKQAAKKGSSTAVALSKSQKKTSAQSQNKPSTASKEKTSAQSQNKPSASSKKKISPVSSKSSKKTHKKIITPASSPVSAAWKKSEPTGLHVERPVNYGGRKLSLDYAGDLLP